jgi:DNA-binding beta-propeller fold protein YncE
VAAAYDDDGSPAWTYVRDDVDGDSSVLTVFSLSDGEAVFVGAAGASGEFQPGMLVLRMSAAGERLSERIVADLSPHSVALIPAGNSGALAVTTSDSLVVVSLEGERLREVAFEPDEDPAGLAVAEDGGVFVVGDRTTDEGHIAPWAARYDAELTKVWDFVGEDGGDLSQVAVGPNGDVFVTGRIVAPPFGGASDFTNYDIWMARIAR